MSNTWIELDVSIFCDNLRRIRAVANPSAELILVIKARAYGHGLPLIARSAWSCGVRCFIVSHLEEARELRQVLPGARILLLGAVTPEMIPFLIGREITPVLIAPEQGRTMAQTLGRSGQKMRCHVKVDTGMGRFGFDWPTAAQEILDLHRRGGVVIEGICTHFASAGRKGDDFAEEQARRFVTVIEACRVGGLQIPFRHVANSAAFNSRPDWDFEGVRCGILAYGYGGRPDSRAQTRPFLQWKTTVVQVRSVPAQYPVGYLSTHRTERPTILATLNVGYADGFSRLLSNGGRVLIGGRRVPVVGRVSMNFTTVDVGSDAAVRSGDEVVLLGRQGDDAIGADELARWCKTIPYEILTSIRSVVRSAEDTRRQTVFEL
jgi:alanine racemase